jgi:hypothetical protein
LDLFEPPSPNEDVLEGPPGVLVVAEEEVSEAEMTTEGA